jgi:hypothetical protein
MAFKNNSLAQRPPGLIERKLGLGEIGPGDYGSWIGQRLEREQQRRSDVAGLALLAREVGQ